MNTVIEIALFALPAIIAITFHEAAHGYVARHFGDDTAEKRGRITLNPLKHIDPFGTILLPAMLLLMHTGFIFGYAKPVPVNPNALRNPRADMVWVAAAGPAMNMLLATVSFALIWPAARVGQTAGQWLVPILLNSILINVLLAIFNLIPLPPLDGGKVAVGLLPNVLAVPLAKLNRFGFLILLAVFVVLPMVGEKIGVNLNLFQMLVQPPLHAVMQAVMFVLPGSG
jgi:Zn-dependent protease